MTHKDQLSSNLGENVKTQGVKWFYLLLYSTTLFLSPHDYITHSNLTLSGSMSVVARYSSRWKLVTASKNLLGGNCSM